MTATMVVAATTAEVLAAIPDGAALLTEAEATRARAFHFDRDRDDFRAAHVLARACAAAVVNVPIDRLSWSQRCEECGGPHGRPAIAEAGGLEVSLAHASGYVAAAVGPRVGVDIEPVGRGTTARANAELARTVLSDADRVALDPAPDPDVAFLRQWVRREALVKLGALTLDTLSTVDLSGLPVGEPNNGWAVHAWRGFVLADFRYGGAIGAVAASEPPRRVPLSAVVRMT